MFAESDRVLNLVHKCLLRTYKILGLLDSTRHSYMKYQVTDFRELIRNAPSVHFPRLVEPWTFDF